MSGIFYGGTPIEQVDFEKEFDKELEMLTDKINKLKERIRTGEKLDYHLWASKLNSVNKALEMGRVTLS